eukprot:scaffold45899_cov30-Phaeocystis_antarctica.AAC.1
MYTVRESRPEAAAVAAAALCEAAILIMSSPACAIVGATKPPPVRSPYFEKSCLCRSFSQILREDAIGLKP